MVAGLGLLQEFADQLIILDYGDMDQLDVIEKRAHEIAWGDRAEIGRCLHQDRPEELAPTRGQVQQPHAPFLVPEHELPAIRHDGERSARGTLHRC